MSNVDWDDRSFQEGVKSLVGKVPNMVKQAVHDVGEEVMRLSSFEVPHDTGMLQNSGHVEQSGDEAVVGYNKVYAARLHEHPEYRFQKGRKGKYLQDPIQNNLGRFIQYIQKAVASVIG